MTNSKTPFTPVPSQPNFRQLEADILQKWKDEKVFEQTQTRSADKDYVFYEGPPTANGKPAIHHVLARSFKDLFPRFKVMQGHHVTRKGGWDTHGLPVEISVEKKLGWLGRNHGASREELEEFNRLCRTSVWETIQDWNELTERMGYWLDLENPYVTYHNEYVESVWNLLKRLHEKGLVAQDYKVVPLSPRISSTLSRAELGEVDSYRMVDDPSVYVKFKVDTRPRMLPKRFVESLNSQGLSYLLDSPKEESSISLLVWTTTPWTLPSNMAVAANPKLDYAIARYGDEYLIFASSALTRISGLKGLDHSLDVVGSLTGDTLRYIQYRAPFNQPVTDNEGEVFSKPMSLSKAFSITYQLLDSGNRRYDHNSKVDESKYWSDFRYQMGKLLERHFVVTADYVSADEGTGLVHQSPAYGADDLVISKENGIIDYGETEKRFFQGDKVVETASVIESRNVLFAVDDHGNFQWGKDYEGQDFLPIPKGTFFKDADKGLIADLKERRLMFWAGTLKHRYPFHDRTGDPILYFAKKGWYIRTSQVAGEMLAQNEKINWVPGNIKHGRFGNWLEGNVDWAISRERYWGTPLPFWMSEDGDLKVVGSVAELSELAGRDLSDLDLHRPYIDDITFTLKGKEYRRIPEVLDVWFDSGSMPYAQWGLLLNEQGEAVRGAEQFEKHYPADYICEAIDQTRGWFYSLHAISTMLYDQPAYKNVICLGHIVDEKGLKMSKSKGNVVEPLPVFDKYGADSVRWYMFMASDPGDQKRFSERLVAEAQRSYVNTLWNVYSFFVLYANLDQPDLNAAPAVSERPEMDRWLLARLEETVRDVTTALEAYDARGGGRALERFVDDLSNWYVRRSRSRFWGEGGQVDTAAYATLHEALLVVSQLTAPFTPFLADALYRNLSGQDSSVHLTNWPQVRAERLDDKLTADMAAVMKVVELGRAVRGAHNLKTRQPLAGVQVRAASPAALEALKRSQEQIMEELNVKSVTFLEGDTDLVQYSLRPNLPVVGKQYGKQLPLLKKALAEADARAVAQAVAAGQGFSVQADGSSFDLTPESVLVDAKAPEGVAAAEDAGYLVAFDTALTPELLREGLARDLVRAIQEARKSAGFEVQDRIRLALDVEGEVLEAAQEWRDFIAGEVLAVDVSYEATEQAGSHVAEVEGGRVLLKRVES